ncbi:MAG: signal peptidase I [Candidatus Woesearchaeota archaeon]
MTKQKPQTWWQKTWHFLWHDDSAAALIAQILVAFIIIKYVLYPAIGLIAGTPLPVVAVISGSMEHQGETLCGEENQGDWWSTCGEWYEERGINQEQFAEFPFRNGFNTGDVIAVRGANNLEVGDIIIFFANKQYPIIHRIVDIPEEGVYLTKGDNNPEPIQQYVLTDGRNLYECYYESNSRIILSPCVQGTTLVTQNTPGAVALLDETQVTKDIIIGKAYARIPWIGYLKIGFVNLLELIGLEAIASRL